LFLGLRLWMWIHLVTVWLLNKLSSWKLWCPISLGLPTTFLGTHLGFAVVFSPSFHQRSIPGLPRRSHLPDTTRCFGPRGGNLSPGETKKQVSVTKRNQKGSGTNLVALLIRLVRTHIRIGLPLGGRKGAW
jgi:hypothetical protein